MWTRRLNIMSLRVVFVLHCVCYGGMAKSQSVLYSHHRQLTTAALDTTHEHVISFFVQQQDTWQIRITPTLGIVALVLL